MLNKSSRVWAPWFGMGCKAQILAIAQLWRGFATPQTAQNRDDRAARDLFSVALAPATGFAPALGLADGLTKTLKARKTKTPSNSITWGYALEEREGFEPSEPCGSPDFESGTFDHSATSPEIGAPVASG